MYAFVWRRAIQVIGYSNRLIHSIPSYRLSPWCLFKSTTTRRHSRHSVDTVSEFHSKAPQATASEGIAQGPYVAARTGFEPSDERRRIYQWATTPHQTASSCFVLQATDMRFYCNGQKVIGWGEHKQFHCRSAYDNWAQYCLNNSATIILGRRQSGTLKKQEGDANTIILSLNKRYRPTSCASFREIFRDWPQELAFDQSVHHPPDRRI